MKYFQQIENIKMVQVVAADSLETCVSHFGGEWYEIAAPPFVGVQEDGHYRPFPLVTPSECILSTYHHLTNEWIILQ